MTEVNKKIQDIRTDYGLGELDENSIASDPFTQFGRWFEEALQSQVLEPNALALGTCGKNGQANVRMVLLKGFDEKGFVFFTNYESKKANEILENPKVAMTFHWKEIQRQVRILGHVEMIDSKESDEYFECRPHDSKIGAWSSPQSEIISDRNFLEEEFQKYTQEFEGKDLPRPPHWGGYRVIPHEVEFWQGRKSRLHDRIRYRLVEGKWIIERLAP